MLGATDVIGLVQVEHQPIVALSTPLSESVEIEMAAVGSLSNADTSQPEERAEQYLHSKSYAAAAVLDPSDSPPGAPERAQPEQNGVTTDGSSSITTGNVNGFPPPKSTKTPKLDNM